MTRFIPKTLKTKSVKDTKGNQVYLNTDGSAINGFDSIYLDKSIKVNKSVGGYQKGEVIVEGTSIGEMFDILFETTARTNPYKSMTKITDYLNYIEYDELDYNYAYKYFKSEFGSKANFGCISVRKGNLYGRNFDYFYDKSSEFIVKTSATPSRHASIGVASCYFDQEYVDAGGFDYRYRILPFYMMDGINDQGVLFNANMLKPGQCNPTIGTNPNSKINITSFMLGRYLLDNANSAAHAVKIIQNDINFYTSYSNLFHDEYHYMIADKNETYIVEFIDNKVVVNKVTNKPIMSNFYYTGARFNNDGTVDESSLHDLSVGVERYNIISTNYDSINDSATMRNVLSQCQMTKAYMKSTNPFWYSEYVGHYDGFGDFTIRTPHEDFEDLIDDYVAKFAQRSRNKELWQTLHSSIYDIDTKTLKVCIQENWNQEYTYSL